MASGLLLCSVGQCSPRVDAPLKAFRAEALPAFQRLQQELQAKLSVAMAKGGPSGALTVCRTASPELEKEVSTGGMQLRRVSDRPRNPNHGPDEFEARVLSAWSADVSAGRSPQVVAERDGAHLRVMKPILIASAMCLACHGAPEAFPEKLKGALKREYPTDRAVGYRLGDLRGAFSATKDAPKP